MPESDQPFPQLLEIVDSHTKQQGRIFSGVHFAVTKQLSFLCYNLMVNRCPREISPSGGTVNVSIIQGYVSILTSGHPEISVYQHCIVIHVVLCEWPIDKKLQLKLGYVTKLECIPYITV